MASKYKWEQIFEACTVTWWLEGGISIRRGELVWTYLESRDAEEQIITLNPGTDKEKIYNVALNKDAQHDLWDWAVDLANRAEEVDLARSEEALKKLLEDYVR